MVGSAQYRGHREAARIPGEPDAMPFVRITPPMLRGETHRDGYELEHPDLFPYFCGIKRLFDRAEPVGQAAIAGTTLAP
jgi:hypothetical protein